MVHGVTEEVVLDVRLARITSPSWRVRAQPMMRPVSVSQPGVEAWIVSRENATVLYNTVARRADFRESISRSLTLENGQTHTFVQRTPRRYLRTVRNSGRSDVRYESVAGEIQEGHQLELSCLVHNKQRTLDLFMKCRLDQGERLRRHGCKSRCRRFRVGNARSASAGRRITCWSSVLVWFRFPVRPLRPRWGYPIPFRRGRAAPTRSCLLSTRVW